MLTKLSEGVGGKLAELWAATLLTPAFFFWAGGIAAWVWRNGPQELEARITGLSRLEQGALVVGGLLAVATSATVARHLTLTVLRFLEGYWPASLRPVRKRLVSWQASRFNKAQERWQELAAKGVQNLTPQEHDEYAALDWRRLHVPTSPERWMPTALGNVLRGAELRPWERYGLDTVIWWPRLWLVLPEAVKKELSEARARLDTLARVWFWGALFLIWTVWAWWAALVGLAVAFFTYGRMVNAAEAFGDVLVSAFDLHRIALYQHLRWPPPPNPAKERQIGKQMTAYLWRGSDEPSPWFTGPPRQA